MLLRQNAEGQDTSHATTSSIPEAPQKQVPQRVEDELPDSVYDTGSN
jgi:hypothetical protein